MQAITCSWCNKSFRLAVVVKSLNTEMKEARLTPASGNEFISFSIHVDLCILESTWIMQ